ncbi:MAG: DUF1684 domain-containing protein [Rudaea sp.]|uniref:DUF1684 domain-containing protein n=1 Tax=Rudaea sp. TaxID=2136325 RepID=UPI0039E382AF
MFLLIRNFTMKTSPDYRKHLVLPISVALALSAGVGAADASWPFAAALLALSGTPALVDAAEGGASQAVSDFKSQHAQWVKEREAELTRPDGWTSLIGLHWVDGKQASVGGGEGNDIRLLIAPDKLGKVEQHDGALFFSAADGAKVTADGKPLQGTVQLKPEGKDGDTKLGYDGGKGQITVIDRQGRLALRVRHADSPDRLHFKGLDVFPPDEQWQVKARFIAHPPGTTIQISNIIGNVNETPNPGYVEFDKDGKTWRLEATGDPAKGLNFIFKDATSGKETYGVGRFLHTGSVAADGTVVVDFNRAYNPPCAFTPYATCPVPPPENRFAQKDGKGEVVRLAVKAGEKKYAGHEEKPVAGG